VGCAPLRKLFPLFFSILVACARLPASPIPTQTGEALPTLTPELTQAASATFTGSPATSPTTTPQPATATPTAQTHMQITPRNAASLAQSASVEYNAWELVLALAWSPDGTILAVAAGEQIYLYSPFEFKERSALDAGVWSTDLQFSPDSRWLASSGRDGGLRVWEVGSGGLLTTIPAHKKGANAVAFDPTGRWLASAGNDGMVRVWDAASGAFETQMIGGSFGIPALAFTPDGQNLAIANGNVVRIRSMQDGRFVQTLRGGESSFSCLAMADGSSLLATGDSANTITIWELDSGNALHQMTGHKGEVSRPSGLVWRVIFSPDGKLLASAGGDGTVRLWDAGSGEQLATLTGHRAAVTSLAFSPDARWLASGGLDARVLIWSVLE
jgi:WD40 repeat protein